MEHSQTETRYQQTYRVELLLWSFGIGSIVILLWR